MSTAALGRPHASTNAGATARARRGSSNRDARGNTKNRRARRRYLVDTYTADVPLIAAWYADGEVNVTGSPFGGSEMAVAAWVDALWSMDERRHGMILAGTPALLHVEVLKACRCYRCGCLLHAGHDGDPERGLGPLEGTVTADRIVPGARGGTYRRENIRPACGPCQETTGGLLGVELKRAPRAAQRPQDGP